MGIIQRAYCFSSVPIRLVKLTASTESLSPLYCDESIFRPRKWNGANYITRIRLWSIVSNYVTHLADSSLIPSHHSKSKPLSRGICIYIIVSSVGTLEGGPERLAFNGSETQTLWRSLAQNSTALNLPKLLTGAALISKLKGRKFKRLRTTYWPTLVAHQKNTFLTHLQYYCLKCVVFVSIWHLQNTVSKSKLGFKLVSSYRNGFFK